MGHIETVIATEAIKTLDPNAPRKEMSSFNSNGTTQDNTSGNNLTTEEHKPEVPDAVVDQQKRDALGWGEMFSGLWNGVVNLTTEPKHWQEMGKSAYAIGGAIAGKIGQFFTDITDPSKSAETATNALGGIGSFFMSTAKTIWTDFGGADAMKGNFLDAAKHFLQTASGYTDLKNAILAFKEGNYGLALLHLTGAALQFAGCVSMVVAGWTGAGALVGAGLMAARNLLYAGGKEALISAGKTAVKDAVVTLGKETIKDFSKEAMQAGFKQVSKDIAKDLVENVAKQQIKTAYREIAVSVGKGSMEEAISRSAKLTELLVKSISSKNSFAEVALKEMAEKAGLKKLASDKAYELVLKLQKATESESALKELLKNKELKEALLKQGYNLDKLYNTTALRKTLSQGLYGEGGDIFKKEIIDQITESFTKTLTADMRKEFETELRKGLLREGNDAFKEVLGRQMTKEEEKLFVEKTVKDVGAAFEAKADEVLRPIIREGVEEGFKRARDERNSKRRRPHANHQNMPDLKNADETAPLDVFKQIDRAKSVDQKVVQTDSVAKRQDFYSQYDITEVEARTKTLGRADFSATDNAVRAVDSSALLAMANKKATEELLEKDIVRKELYLSKQKLEAPTDMAARNVEKTTV